MQSFKIKDMEISGLNVSLEILNLGDSETLKKYIDLFELCFGKRSNIDATLFDWLNNQLQYKNINFAFLDKKTNELIAAYSLQPGDAFVDGSIKKYALCTNVMSHPDYGGKGLFRFIGKEALSYVGGLGINFCFGVPNDKALNGHLKVGWEIINEITFYERGFAGDEKFSAVNGIVPDFLDKLTDADLFSLYGNKYNFYFLRTSAWNKWRTSKPHSKYFSFGLNSESDNGYVVLKEYKDPVTAKKKLHIVDFGYNNLSCFNKLLDHCCWIAQQGKFDISNLWHYSFNEVETQQLLSKGFKETEQKNPIIIHTLGKDMEIPKSNWHVTLFDNDVY